MAATTLRSLAMAGFRRRLQSWAGIQKEDGGGAGIWGGAFDSFMGITRDGGSMREVKDQAADYAYARTADSYLFTCEQVRGRAISQVPLKCWEMDAQGQRKPIEHDAIGVLQQTNPYGWVHGTALHRYTLTSLDFHGRSAWQCAFNRRGEPTEIYWLPPLGYEPLPDKDKPMRVLGGVRVHDELGVRTIPAAELVYMATDNPQDPLAGTSKISVLRHPINLRAYSQQNNIDFFKNSMRPDWVLAGSFANTDENTSRLRRSIRRWLSGANNRAPLVLGEGMTAHLLSTSHEDAQWVEQQRLAQEEMSAVFGVPLIYLNNLERATYENIRTAKVLLWHDTMIPEGDMLADFYNSQFLWRFWPGTRDRRITLGFDYSEIEGLGEDLALIWERVVNMSKQISEQVRNRELTPHQARLLRDQLYGDLGLDTAAFQGQIPGGDTFYDAFQNVPVDQLSIQALMNVWAMRGQNPEFVEDVPGAPTAGDNAEDVAARLNKPSEPPSLPPTPLPPTPGLPPAGDTPPQPPEAPAKAIDVEALRQQVAGEIREQVERTVGEAAVRAFGQALELMQGPQEPSADQRLLERRLKRYFSDQQTDSLRTLRQAQATGSIPPKALYSFRVYEDRLAELIGPERAREVEAVTKAALWQATPAEVPGVFRHAIDIRASAIAAGKAVAASESEGDPLSRRPLHAQVSAAEDHYADQVQQSLREVLDVERAASEWLALSGQRKAAGVTVSADLLSVAEQFVASFGLDFSGFAPVIRAIYQDGWRVGVGAALKLLAGRDMPAESSDEAAGIDWSAWQPGNPAAAQQAAGLADLLQQAAVVIQGISDTTLDQIAQALAQGAAAGDSVQTIAKALTDLLGDSERALVIAHTELARAQSAASLDTYRINGIQGKGWLTFSPCPICASNEAAGTIPLDASFPGGVQSPPQHARCRCSLVPGQVAAGAGTAATTGEAAEVLMSAAAGVELYAKAS